MKKYYLFYLLSLFLLAKASITRAQITKTINGTVRYESGISETQFTTPYGNVKIDLPQSLSGAVISGTVTTEPAGKNEKEKNRNLKDLLKMTLVLGDQKIPMNEIPFLFDWKPNPGTGQRTPVRLTNFLGNEIGEVSLPPVIITPHIVNPQEPGQLSIPSNVTIKGDLLNVYTDKAFTPGEKFVITDGKGEQFILKPKCLSAQQAVIELPQNIAPGPITVTEEIWNQPVQSFDTRSAKTTLMDLTISSPNTNLRPRQKSEVIVNCIVTDSKGEWVNPDIEKLISGTMTIDLRNHNPNTVTMEGGNLQRVNLPGYSKVVGNVGAELFENGNWVIKRNITGNAVGTFSVSATLHEDYNTSNDPFRPQINDLKTPEDFNAWTDALKRDLNQYRTLVTDDDILWPPNTQDYSIIKTNAQRAIDNMPVCGSPEQLDECKAVAYSLVQPLNIPKGSAISWGSSYESFKSMINSSSVMTGQDDLPDWDVIQNGLNLIQRIGYKTNDPAINSEADNAGQILDKCRETVPSANQLEQLRNSLQTLVKNTDSKIKSQAEKNSLWNLSNLLYDTYCLNKRTRDGIDPQKSMIGYLDPKNKILKVKPEYQQQILNSLNAVPSGSETYRINAMSETRMPVSYHIQVMPLIVANIYDGEWWTKQLIEKAKKDTSKGNIITTSQDSTGTWYIFYRDAECKKIVDAEKFDKCYPHETFVYDEKTKKGEFVKDGKYFKFEFLPSGSCKKGNKYCTEMLQVFRIDYIYKDKECTNLISIEKTNGFSCL